MGHNRAVTSPLVAVYDTVYINTGGSEKLGLALHTGRANPGFSDQSGFIHYR